MGCARKIQSNTAESGEPNRTLTQRRQALLIAPLQITRQQRNITSEAAVQMEKE